ncbi:hypothetical protein [Leucothrix arctica]|uniref:Sulfotransferase domain-containing protein n=1 Tax=Leucothrix arctica TaxID=1481894 RepID=A0A317CJE4_9GAMM|nr:hypothetical protein [Leucothrix arctica]PWQ98695.1 hypothetical protein DKT75_02475 [Leucothrix arctica]
MKKEIFIHIGPPKTGTSAIQKWLSEHRKELKKQGLYYPDHRTDENGVSSGNLLSIFSRKEDNSLYIDTTKVASLLSCFYSNNKYNKLLLSSEFFFMRMNEVREAIPDAIFIGYLRNPIEKRESQYNQGVKRALFKHKYPNKTHHNAQDLSILTKYIKSHTCSKLILRPYGPQFFSGGNIASDLLETIDLNKTEAKLPNINNSYNLEALELKRWLNNFPLGNIATKIDICLQSFDSGVAEYTLINPEILKKQLKIDLKAIRLFFELVDTNFSEDFIGNIINSKKQKFYDQELESSKLVNVMRYLKRKLGNESKILLKILENDKETKNDYAIIFIEILKEKNTYELIKKNISIKLKVFNFFH